jgi:hypothetical protein
LPRKEKWQYEDTGGDVGQHFRLYGCPVCGLKGDEHDQRVLEHIVVKGAEKLGQEKRQKPALTEQRELAAHAFSAQVFSVT